MKTIYILFIYLFVIGIFFSFFQVIYAQGEVMGDKGVGGHHSDDAGDGEQSTAASWTGKALDFLKVLHNIPITPIK